MLEKANSGSGGRGGSRKGSNLPGPADYDAANSMNIIQSTGPAYTLGKKIHSSKVESGNPGPNNYFLKGENSEIKNGITMKGRNSPHVMVFPTTRFNTLK